MKCPYTNIRNIEEGVEQDFSDKMSYGDYLNMKDLLSLQTPLGDSHDEMLFIIIHQASELWIKLAGYELASAMEDIKADKFGVAQKKLSRIGRIQEQLIQSWTVLSTMTPADYLTFRDDLGESSGFQSVGYRSLEFMLGNKHKGMLNVHQHDEEAYNSLKTILEAPSVYDIVLEKLSHHYPIDGVVLNRDVTEPYVFNKSVLDAWKNVYKNSHEQWELYELAEKLVDIEDWFQQWRHRHLSTVVRVIGFRKGTGGSSGVEFLKKALDISFFPELYEVRTVL